MNRRATSASRPGAWLRRIAVRISLLSLVVLLLTAWIGSALWPWLYGGLPELPFPVSINGHDVGGWWHQLDTALQAMGPRQQLALVGALALAILLLAVLVPLTVLLMAATVLGMAMLLLALLSSPLWLAGLLLWWLLRPAHAPTAAPRHRTAPATTRPTSDSMPA